MSSDRKNRQADVENAPHTHSVYVVRWKSEQGNGQKATLRHKTAALERVRKLRQRGLKCEVFVADNGPWRKADI